MLAFIAIAAALADPGLGVLLPSALPVEAGTGSVGGGIGVRIGEQGTAIATGIAEGETAAGDFVFGGRLFGGPVVAPARGAYPMGFGVMHARYQGWAGDKFRFMPWLGAGALLIGNSQGATAGSLVPSEGLGAAVLGLAIEGGGGVLRYDLSLPAVGVAYDGARMLLAPPWYGGLISDFGIGVRVTDDHLVRLGFTGVFVPGLRWTWANQGWYLSTALSWALLEGFGAGVGVQAGLRF